MTFCIALRVREGLVALGDTRIVKGGEHVSKRKLYNRSVEGGAFFTMTSGLRSIRDKLLTYAEAPLDAFNGKRLFEVANLLGNLLKRIWAEDGAALANSRFTFDLHVIVGGRLADDTSLVAYLIYPQGNWIEINEDAPYFAIGRTTYGLPLIKNCLDPEMAIESAAILALLTFDSVANSVVDVDYPVDMAVMRSGVLQITQHRFDREALAPLMGDWRQSLRNQISALAAGGLNPLLAAPRRPL